HYLRDGVVVGWGPTVREIDQLAELFDEVTHIAFLHPDPPPKSALPYQSPRVHLRPLPPAGGARFADKLNILARYPQYLRTLLGEMRRADVVPVRAPANISLLAMVALAFERAPRIRWIKYAGNWQPNGGEPISYRFQRWWLRHNFARSEVT